LMKCLFPTHSLRPIRNPLFFSEQITILDFVVMTSVVVHICWQYVVKIAEVTMGDLRNRGDLDNTKTLYVVLGTKHQAPPPPLDPRGGIIIPCRVNKIQGFIFAGGLHPPDP
jgi:hypothetical protein